MRAGSVAVIAAGGALGAAAGLYAMQDHSVPATTLNVAAASAGTVLASIAAYLFLLRMRRTRTIVDVLLAVSVTLVAMSSLVLAAVAGIDVKAGALTPHALVSVAAALVVSLGLAAAAFAPERRVADPDRNAERLLGWAIVLALLTISGIAGTLLVAQSVGHDLALVLADATSALLAAAAAVGFVRRADRHDHLVFLWLATAAAITAVARLTDAALPWSRVYDFSSGDVVQLAGWLALLIAGVRDLETAHRGQTLAAVVGERRRLARELHDGLAQDLAYITFESRRHTNTRHLAEAAERALEESRAAIAALARPEGEPLDKTVSDAALSLAERAGIDVSVALRPGLEAPAETRDALLKVMREAMTNAARHGQATAVRISLDGPAPLVMAIADNGRGFDVGAARRPDSFGLQSMAERATNLGGRMTIESLPGQGTTVAVVLP